MEGTKPLIPFSSSSCPFCLSSTNTPPCLSHVLHHKTTRTPLYLHPSCWSFTHIDILRVILNSLSPLPQPSQSSKIFNKPGSITPSILRRVLNPAALLSPFNDVSGLLTSTINSFQSTIRPFFRIYHDPHELSFDFGQATTKLKPLLYVSHTDRIMNSVPFLAYNDPDHRHCKRQLNSRARRPRGLVDWSNDPVTGKEVGANLVDPFDVGVLIAMAQMQAVVLTEAEVYKTYLLHPNTEGTQVRLLAAEISAHYLECLRDLSLPLSDQLVIYRKVIVISETGQEFLDLVRSILQAAPVLPAVKKEPAKVGKSKDTRKVEGKTTSRKEKRREYKGGGEKHHPPRKKAVGAQKSTENSN